MQIKATFAASTIRRIKARNHQIGLIHEAKSQLGLAETGYRDVIATASRGQTRTSAELDARGRQRALRALREMGYVEGASRSPSAEKRREVRLKDLADIHRAQRGLGLSDSVYRALVATASGGKSRSCADLNARERAQVKKALGARGFDFAPA
jgi:hypothetical protein